MTYAEKELLPHGYKLESISSKHASFSLQNGFLVINLVCGCPAYPNIQAMGCPLHHHGPGGSWPIFEAINIAENMRNPKIKAAS